MDVLVRKLALRATAKVALGMTVVGCASTVAVEKQDSSITDDPLPYEPPVALDEEQEQQEEETYPVYLPPKPGEELMCSAPPVGEEVALDDEQFQCCVDALIPITPHEGEGWDQWQDTMQDGEVQACCNVVAVHAEVDHQRIEELGWEKFNACCSSLDHPPGACTPWGPPVPPAITDLPLIAGLV